MIKKFQEYISEGMWKSGVKRASDNYMRLEDRLNDTNLYDLKGVDWGDFLIADQLLVTNKTNKYFNYQKLKDLMPYIEQAGWRLMTKKEANRFCVDTTWETLPAEDGEFEPRFVFINLKNQESVRYKRHSEIAGIFNFIIQELGNPNNTYCARLVPGSVGKNKLSLTWIERTTYAPVILVKDKKPVNEGMWKDGVNRAKSGELREEDKVTNIEKLDTIDMGIDGVLFASDDLTINGECFISNKSLEEHLPYIESQGWRIPTGKEMIKWFKNGNGINKYKYEVVGVTMDKSYYIITSKKTKESLSFPLTELKGTDALYGPITETYWLASDGDRQAIMHLKPKYDENPFDFFEIMKGNYKPSRIRLVKDVAVNEGLWKDGVSRAKSGEQREEDRTPFDRYLETVEWVDMGDPEYLYAKHDHSTEYVYSDEHLFSVKDLLELKLPDGVEVMGQRNVKFLKGNCDFSLVPDETIKFPIKMKAVCATSESGNEIFFHLHPWFPPVAKCSYAGKIMPTSLKGHVNIAGMVVKMSKDEDDMLQNSPNVVVDKSGKRYDEKLFTIKLIKRK